MYFLANKKILMRVIGFLLIIAGIVVFAFNFKNLGVIAAGSEITKKQELAIFIAQNKLTNHGYTADPNYYEVKNIVVPNDFDIILDGYNDMIKQNGYDLNEQKGREAVKVVLKLTDYPNSSGDVFSSFLIVDNIVVAADLYSGGEDGFLINLTPKMQ